MFEKFQEAVRNAYLDLKNNNQLDFPREWPSTGDLKNWCQQCLESGLTKDDETIFKTFFNATFSDKPLKEIIRKFEADKLRSLRNFIINDNVKRPDRDLVKLLAVLVNFEQRPYNRDDWDDNSSIKKPPFRPNFVKVEKQHEIQEGNEIEKTTNITGGEGITKEDSSKFDKSDDTSRLIEKKSESGILKTVVLDINEEGKKDCEETVTSPEGEIKREEELINLDNLVIHKRDVEEKTVHVADATYTVIDSKTIDKDSPIIKDQAIYSKGDNGKAEDTPLSGDNLFGIKGLYGTSAEDNKVASTTDGSAGVNTETVSPPNPIKGKTFFRNKANYPCGGLVIIIITVLIFSFINKECMCWNGINYIKVDCKDNKQPNQIVGLNEDKFNNFQKIMRPDTLSKADVGKIWYSKIDNEVEFFTHAGYHPIHNKKSLKAATEHIIRTYSGNKNLD